MGSGVAIGKRDAHFAFARTFGLDVPTSGRSKVVSGDVQCLGDHVRQALRSLVVWQVKLIVLTKEETHDSI